jgi:3-methyl-2-oxobutanoate hydroxymethyltransferase
MTQRFAQMKSSGEKIAALTCYDAAFAAVGARAGVDILLVGDSLGMVLHGRRDTLGVTMAQMAYHTRCVAAGAGGAFVLADMPFGSYQQSPRRAFANAARLLSAGAQMVKIEGGAAFADTVAFLSARGVPVCAHLGLLPQSVHIYGGYKVQGATAAAARRLREDALALQEAGALLLVLELIPASLAAELSGELAIPTIGIGAGAACDGQVLVLHDMLGISKPKRLARDFMQGADSVFGAIGDYARAVKAGEFPSAEHSF